MKKIVGIDLGTTTTCVITLDDKLVSVGSQLRLPTAITITGPDRYYVNDDSARSALIDNPNRVVPGFMRLVHDELQHPRLVDFIKWTPYELARDEHDQCLVQLRDGHLDTTITVSLTDILTSFFKELAVKIGPRQHLALALSGTLGEQQQALVRAAAKKASLPIQSLCYTSEALALAYGRNHQVTDRIIAFCDFGAGTLDVSIVYFGGDGAYQLLSAYSDPLLGGGDFDLRIAQWILSQLTIEYPGYAWETIPYIRARILTEAQTLKELLSDRAEVKVQLPFLYQTQDLKILHFPVSNPLVLTRAMLGELTRDLLAQIEHVCRTAIETSPVDRYEIDSIVVLGEQAKMHAFQDCVERVFGKPPIFQPHTKAWIAEGAALLDHQNDHKQFMYAPLSMRYGPKIGEILRETDRQQWQFICHLLAAEPAYYACLADQRELFLAFVTTLRQIDLAELLHTSPSFSLLLFRHGLSALITLAPELRRTVIMQLHEFRQELEQIAEHDRTAVMSAAMQSSVRSVLEIYRDYEQVGAAARLEKIE